MSTITKEWLESQISAIKAVGITDSNTLQAFEIALASLEAEPAIHRWRRVTFEPYGPYPWHYGNFIGFSKPVDGIEDEYYYAAPPAPVSVPAAMEMDDDFDSAFEHGKAVGWNACRDAMLKHSEPFIVTSDHRMMEMPQVEAINAVTAMLHGAEPVTTAYKLPEGWVAVPVEPTEEMIAAAMCSNDVLFDKEDDTLFRVQHGEIWRAMLSTAPQQEVTQALAKGMERYGDAMQELAKKEVK